MRWYGGQSQLYEPKPAGHFRSNGLHPPVYLLSHLHQSVSCWENRNNKRWLTTGEARKEIQVKGWEHLWEDGSLSITVPPTPNAFSSAQNDGLLPTHFFCFFPVLIYVGYSGKVAQIDDSNVEKLFLLPWLLMM